MRKTGNQKSRSGITLVEMAVVLFVIATMLAIVGSFIGSLAFLKTINDEAIILKDTIQFARQSARKSGRPVYVEFDLDEDSYRAFRIDRTEKETKEMNLVNTRKLSGFNSIVSTMNAAGIKMDKGKVKIAIDQYGNGEELIVHLGSVDGEVKRSIHISRYGDETRILQGEAQINLEKPEWMEDMEAW